MAFLEKLFPYNCITVSRQYATANFALDATIFYKFCHKRNNRKLVVFCRLVFIYNMVCLPYVIFRVLLNYSDEQTIFCKRCKRVVFPLYAPSDVTFY